MSTSKTPTGFTLVLKVCDERGERGTRLNPRYHGVNREPSYPSEYEEENDALDEYVFGEYKDLETDLIPSIELAREVLESLSGLRRSFELLFCCHGPDDEAIQEVEGNRLVPLGYDVAFVTGDGWSIVSDFSDGDWARPFCSRLNENGLFNTRIDAESYLALYVEHKDIDYDGPFDVAYIVWVDLGDLGAGSE